jgi:hypothetical protein
MIHQQTVDEDIAPTHPVQEDQIHSIFVIATVTIVDLRAGRVSWPVLF